MHADAEPDRQPGGREFLDDLQVGFVRLAAATVLFRIRQGQQARPAKGRELRARECAVAFRGRDPRPQLRVGDVPSQAEQRGGDVVPRLPVDAGH